MNNLLHYFLILILVSFFLPTFVALPFTPGASFYAPFWLILLALNYPKIFVSKGFLICYLFVFVHIIKFIYSDAYKVLEFESTFAYTAMCLAFAISLLEYFKMLNNPIQFKQIGTLSFVLIMTTCVTCIISLNIFPDASRFLAGAGSVANSTVENTGIIELYMLYGIASYDFYHGVAFIFPVFSTLFLTKNKLFERKKFIIPIALFLSCIYFGQYSSTLGLILIGSIFSLIIPKLKNMTQYLLISVITIFLVSFSGKIISPVLYSLADILNSENFSPRLRNVGANLDGSYLQLDDKDREYTESYEEQKNISLQSFYNNPILGENEIGGHHFWYDIIGRYGLFGLGVWISFLSYIFKDISNRLLGSFKIIYLHIFISFVFLGIYKPILIFAMITYITFFAPVFLLMFQNKSWFLKDKKLI
jgi:hypothetical protein